MYSVATNRVARSALLVVGLLFIVAGYQLADRPGNETAFTSGDVVVTAALPTESFFPVQFTVTNRFQTMTNVRLSCTLERIFINQIDFLNTDILSTEDVSVMAKDAQHAFQCQAPAELHPPFHLGDVHDAHITMEVAFSVGDRRRRMGVSQGFDLVNEPAPHWQPVAPVLSR